MNEFIFECVSHFVIVLIIARFSPPEWIPTSNPAQYNLTTLRVGTGRKNSNVGPFLLRKLYNIRIGLSDCGKSVHLLFTYVILTTRKFAYPKGLLNNSETLLNQEISRKKMLWRKVRGLFIVLLFFLNLLCVVATHSTWFPSKFSIAQTFSSYLFTAGNTDRVKVMYFCGENSGLSGNFNAWMRWGVVVMKISWVLSKLWRHSRAFWL